MRVGAGIGIASKIISALVAEKSRSNDFGSYHGTSPNFTAPKANGPRLCIQVVGRSGHVDCPGCGDHLAVGLMPVSVDANLEFITKAYELWAAPDCAPAPKPRGGSRAAVHARISVSAMHLLA